MATKRTSRKHRSSSDKFLRFIPTDKGKVPDQLIAKHFPYAADAEWRYSVTVESNKMPYPKVITYAKDGDHMLRIAQELIKRGVAEHEIFFMAEDRDDYSGKKAKIPTSTPSAVVLSMPKIPQYPAKARDIFELTDVELSTLFDIYHADGIDPNGCSALHRQTIATLTERRMIKYAEIAKLWRVSDWGKCVVESTKILCGPSSPYRSLQESKMAKVLTFSAPTAESRAQ